MQSYKTYHNELEEAFKWNFLKKAFDWVKKKILSIVKRLGFGQTARIPLKPPNLVMENLLREGTGGGGGGSSLLGVYGEWCTALHVYEMMEKINAKKHVFNIDPKKIEPIRKGKLAREAVLKNIAKLSKNPKWDGKFMKIDANGRQKEVDWARQLSGANSKAYFDDAEMVAATWQDYDRKTVLGAEGIISIMLEHMEDQEICTFDIDMSGGGGGKGDEGTADLIINKMDKDKVVDEIKISLKTYMQGIDKTLGTTISGWFNALCEIGGLPNPKRMQYYWMDPDFLKAIQKRFGSEMAEFTKQIGDLDYAIYNVPNHKMIKAIPPEKWDDSGAVIEWYNRKIGEAKAYGPPTSFKTVNDAIEKFPDIFYQIKPAKISKRDGSILRPEEKVLKATAENRKNYVLKMTGMVTNAIGSAAWIRMLEIMMKDPKMKRDLVNWFLDRFEIKRGKPYFISVGTPNSKKGGRKDVVDIKRPSKMLIENWDAIVDSITIDMKIEYEGEIKNFNPAKKAPGQILDKMLKDGIPQHYGSTTWTLSIPGYKDFTWKWGMYAHPAGEGQENIYADNIQTSAEISHQLTKELADKFGIDLHLDD